MKREADDKRFDLGEKVYEEDTINCCVGDNAGDVVDDFGSLNEFDSAFALDLAGSLRLFCDSREGFIFEKAIEAMEGEVKIALVLEFLEEIGDWVWFAGVVGSDGDDSEFGKRW